MKTVIISFCDIYMARAYQIEAYYQSKQDETLILASTFAHQQLKEKTIERPGVRQVYQKPYQKNLSVGRMLGYRGFSKRIVQELEKERPDRIHCLLPSNQLAHEVAMYKKAHPETELIFDVNDLWPESFPIESIGRIWPASWIFSRWKHLRDDALPMADRLICECGLYQSYLPKQQAQKASVVYWALPGEAKPKTEAAPRNSFLYLGTMNHLIDLDLMIAFLNSFQKEDQAVLHIIGGGESKPALMDALKTMPVEVIDHGFCYDETEKQKIFDQCRFGLNMMKPEIKVGLSTKSIDYLRAGLPLVNSIQADTAAFCAKEGAGFNVDRKNPQATADLIRNQDDEAYLKMSKAAADVFRRHLSSGAFAQAMDAAFNQGKVQV